MDTHENKAASPDETALGIEFGSTRIKAVLIDHAGNTVATGSYIWESHLEGEFWSYRLDEAIAGLQSCTAQIIASAVKHFGCVPQVSVIGISGMMHGYLPFDSDGRQLVPFRTWRCTDTATAAECLSELFDFNIPYRWTIAHLESAIINSEEHVGSIDFVTTLAGYVHWRLTGRRVVGVGEASGIFPIDENGNYDKKMLRDYNSRLEARGIPWRLDDILPQALRAGENAGCLTVEGAMLLDPSGVLKPGIPFCPPEGDAETGMAATNSVAPYTGNVSAGTSIFAMIVLAEKLRGRFREIDIVATPDGAPVAMVHAACCTNEINAWAQLLCDFTALCGSEAPTMDTVYKKIFLSAFDAEPDCGGITACNFICDEPLMGLNGFPALIRPQTASLSMGNFLRAQLYAAVAPLRIGMDILRAHTDLRIDCLTGHGGFFKTPPVGQCILAAALNTPVETLDTAGEGGPWGMALLAAYFAFKAPGETLADYLDNRIFSSVQRGSTPPNPADAEGFDRYLERYRLLIDAERAISAKPW